MINLKMISRLRPCQDRLDNYVKHYGNREFTNRQFMGLKNITHDDKLWVAFLRMPKNDVRLAAADIAESVLHIYETAYPNDLRPRKAIESVRLYVAGNIPVGELIAATRASSDAAVQAYSDSSAAYSAYYAARAAYYAACAAQFAFVYAEHVAKASYDAVLAVEAAKHAASAIYFTYPTDARFAAANVSYAAKSARTAQEKLIRTIILRYWK